MRCLAHAYCDKCHIWPVEVQSGICSSALSWVVSAVMRCLFLCSQTRLVLILPPSASDRSYHQVRHFAGILSPNYPKFPRYAFSALRLPRFQLASSLFVMLLSLKTPFGLVALPAPCSLPLLMSGPRQRAQDLVMAAENFHYPIVSVRLLTSLHLFPSPIACSAQIS